MSETPPKHQKQQISVKEKKRIQNLSINQRQMVMMGSLVHNFKYSIVLNRPQKRATVGIEYFPIETIYNENNEIVYDRHQMVTGNNQNNEKAKRKAIEVMRTHLEEKGYFFDQRYTNKTKIPVQGENITLMKIFSLTYNCNYFEMEQLEQSMGMKIHQMMTEFTLNNNLNQFIFVHCKLDQLPIDRMRFDIEYDNEKMIETYFMDPIILKR